MESGRNQVSELEEITRQSLLYDFYGELLTKRQQQVMQLYHEENLSLAEIAEEFGISRQGVHDALRSAHRSLDSYEEKLGLVQRFLRTENAIGEIDEEIMSMIGQLQGTVPDGRKHAAGSRPADGADSARAGEAAVSGTSAEDLIRRLQKVRLIIDRLEE